MTPRTYLVSGLILAMISWSCPAARASYSERFEEIAVQLEKGQDPRSRQACAWNFALSLPPGMILAAALVPELIDNLRSLPPARSHEQLLWNGIAVVLNGLVLGVPPLIPAAVLEYLDRMRHRRPRAQELRFMKAALDSASAGYMGPETDALHEDIQRMAERLALEQGRPVPSIEHDQVLEWLKKWDQDEASGPPAAVLSPRGAFLIYVGQALSQPATG